MKTLLICHKDADLTRIGMARWLSSFSELVGIIVLQETKRRIWRRIRREIKRVGVRRFFLDVISFRIYYALFISKKDRLWEEQKLKELCSIYSEVPENVSLLCTSSPNSSEAEQFIKNLCPDIILARCKSLLNERIFLIPPKGTFVLHPGICPEYRNAHGCFWALANDDLDKVGMTLLQIDKGVDTGPVYGYYGYKYDEVNESHVIIQHKVVFENLEVLQNKLLEIYNGKAIPLDTSNRPSGTWGQPWLSRYLKWKFKARGRSR
jgi:hypothetical protein